MSARARALKTLYKRGKVSLNGLNQAVADGVITAEEYHGITGLDYVVSA